MNYDTTKCAARVGVIILLLFPLFVAAQSAPSNLSDANQGVAKITLANDQFLTSFGSFFVQLFGTVHLFGHIYLGSNTITKNIVADYGATCDGVHSDNAAFAAFNAAMQGATAPVVLTIPRGATCCLNNNFYAPFYPFSGISNLTVNGSGATITDTCNGTTGAYHLGSPGMPQNTSASALVQSVSAGASCVTLLTAANSSRFTIGNWGIMTAVDLQGYGFPPNPGIFEYVKIASINSGTGIICFNAPLANTYLSTYPSYAVGTNFTISMGGPATLYALPASWNETEVFNGLTLSDTGQIYSASYSITYNNVTVTNSAGIIPSMRARVCAASSAWLSVTEQYSARF